MSTFSSNTLYNVGTVVAATQATVVVVAMRVSIASSTVAERRHRRVYWRSKLEGMAHSRIFSDYRHLEQAESTPR